MFRISLNHAAHLSNKDDQIHLPPHLMPSVNAFKLRFNVINSELGEFHLLDPMFNNGISV